MLTSPSPEVTTIARIAANDQRTTTGSNNWLIMNLGLDPATATPQMVRERLREDEPVENEEQMAMMGLLMELLQKRGDAYDSGEEEDQVI